MTLGEGRCFHSGFGLMTLVLVPAPAPAPPRVSPTLAKCNYAEKIKGAFGNPYLDELALDAHRLSTFHCQLDHDILERIHLLHVGLLDVSMIAIGSGSDFFNEKIGLEREKYEVHPRDFMQMQ
ncbi:hypothetical protein KQX54_003418 [Cotesia glomerata]|uniref:Uncharacterized protein n=1 Tax=Cotesia glomerata TaxID=32391 RepID=A0AAV7HWH5_COTGL|nr:hypothetical protein KQX54_003418 [Cotesia glomerata]